MFVCLFQADDATLHQHNTDHHHSGRRIIGWGHQRAPGATNLRRTAKGPRRGHPDPELPQPVPSPYQV